MEGSTDTPEFPDSPGSPGAPVDFLTQRGYSVPMCTQFSVFLENRVGKMNELLEVFDGTPVRIGALSVIDSSDHAVVRILTSHASQTRGLLKQHGLPYTESPILVVELGDGVRLTKVCLALLSAELNMYYAYPLMSRPNGRPVIAINTDDQVLAGQLLQRKMFRLLGEAELR